MLDAQYIPNSVHLDKVKYGFQTLEVATMLRTALRQHHTVLRQLQELRIDTSASFTRMTLVKGSIPSAPDGVLAFWVALCVLAFWAGWVGRVLAFSRFGPWVGRVLAFSRSGLWAGLCSGVLVCWALGGLCSRVFEPSKLNLIQYGIFSHSCVLTLISTT